MYAEGDKSSKRARWSPAPTSTCSNSQRSNSQHTSSIIQQQQPSGWQPMISSIDLSTSANSTSSTRRPRKTRWDEPPKGYAGLVPPPTPPPQTAIIPPLGPGLPASVPATQTEIRKAIEEMCQQNAYLDDLLLSSANPDMVAVQRRLRQDRLQAMIRRMIHESKQEDEEKRKKTPSDE